MGNMSTEFSIRITESNLKAILESIDAVRSAHPELADVTLSLEMAFELIPDGIGYEIGATSTNVVIDGQDTPVGTFETLSLEEVTEKASLN